ncbi:RHS repeat-associated core domain-containing protein [Streptomyces sp. NBC_01268]|uniref:RHS repeat-associated core domain-containing protein n=1 Tax=Streptomyces sp. NBC_01268 TaxID=2903806 RepID=UPI002E2FF1B2|nr:RHS repeat-associated core domain-containing protein [Streptomyces sp. NBC_01268]
MVLPLAAALSVPIGLTPVAAADGEGGLGRPALPAPRASRVEPVNDVVARKARAQVAKELRDNEAEAGRARIERQRDDWPKAGAADLTLAKEAATATPGGLPVAVTPVKGKAGVPTGAEATVTVLDQTIASRLGITGVVLTAEAQQGGSAEVSVGYDAFASAIGGGWSGRLRLVQLPACALTTPQKAECRIQKPLASRNDTKRRTVSAPVVIAKADSGTATQLGAAGSDATVLALTASGAGTQSPKGTGDYGATPLSASSSWAAGGNSGSFTWSYGLTLPPVAAGPVPSLGISYDSGSIDGRTGTSNNQGTSVGEGFAFTESYIERSYASCDDEGHDDVFDRCWKYDNARLVLNGKSSRLVKVSQDTWRLENDDASQVTRSTGADNTDDEGEYWTVTTGDGTKYVFGKDKLDGATTERTNSAWAAPVFGDNVGEPGYDKGTTFAARSLNKAWRWNLDYVEDTRGNAATYWYAKESNYYKKNKATKADAAYTRGGYLTEIKYGLRKDALFSPAGAKVTLRYTERCDTDGDLCPALIKETADMWPDVPFDALCDKDSTDCSATSPSFFSRKRLIGIDTGSRIGSTNGYDPVDSWAFAQEYVANGDLAVPSDQTLTLKSITRTANAGSAALPMKPVAFTYTKLRNRVDGSTDDVLPLTRPRISTITSETGGITKVTLSAEECVRSQLPAEDTNTRNCYPQYWHINGAPDAKLDWFHKYRVLGVTTAGFAGNDAVEYSYVYSGAAWHYNDDPFTPKAERTWSDWRGYREVTSYKGADSTIFPRSKTVSLYMQGMHGDKNKDGTTKSASVVKLAQPPINVPTLVDSDQYAGTLREQVTYDGSTPLTATAGKPWSKESARQKSIPDADDHVARFVRTEQATTYTYLTAAGTWRSRATATLGFDAYGMPTKAVDLGDEAKTGDETCTETWYARNDNAGLTNLVSRVRQVSGDCNVPESDLKLANADGTRGNVLSDTAISYDNIGWSATMTPTNGLPTWTGRASSYPAAGKVSWDDLTSTAYDTLGRPTSVTDAGGNATTTTYTPADMRPLTSTRVTNAKSHNVNTYFDPRRGLPLRTYDANGKKTELAYDALGRLTDVWLPNRISSTETANIKYAYSLSDTTQSWVRTSTLKADGTTYNDSYTIYDSLLRPLQTQSPTPQGGRLLTDTRYNSRGLAYETYADVFNTSSGPTGTYQRAEYGGAPVQTETLFDGAERATTSTLRVFGVQKWSTSTSYTGDSTATTALQGGSAKRTIVDALGRTAETREYAGPNPADSQYGATLGSSYTSTTFDYTLDGKQAQIVGPDKAVWRYTYDQFGRQKTAVDPDKGTTSTEYDVLDRPNKVTTGGKSVVTAYDVLGRPTETWAGTVADANLLTSRTYDTVSKGLGLPASSTRYIKGKTGDAYTKSVTAYDALSRPTNTRLTLPITDTLYAPLTNGTLDFETLYRIDGTVSRTSEPAMGGLASELIGYTYGSLGQLTTVKGASDYLQNANYSALGQVEQLTLGRGGTGEKNLYVNNRYETGTGRLLRSFVVDQTNPYMPQDLTYTADQAGNITAIADPATLGGKGKAETQCFTYDGYRRLTEAWTPASQNCTDTKDATTLSGPAPYWTSYTYNQGGQRQTETQHAATGDTTTTYCYNAANQPHALRYTTARTACGTADPAKDKVYDYDTTGNTTKRPGKTAQQELTWSDEGRLAKLVENSTSTDYIYDADGTLLIRNTTGGERILYAGATELHLRADKSTWAQRTYTAGSTPIAVRTNQTGTVQVQFLAGDHHGTQTLAVTSDTTQTATKRYMTPFGAERGGAIGTWPTDRGFLDKTADKTTGLTHIGAREYDPVIGQFISVDPALVLDQHQSLNGYAYANNTPVTSSDTTGLWIDDGTGHNEPGGGPGGGQSSTPGVPPGGTGAGGCYYACSSKGDGDPTKSAGKGTSGGSKGLGDLDDSKSSCAIYPFVSGKCSALPEYYGDIEYPLGYSTDPAFLSAVNELGPYDIADMWMNGMGQYIPVLVFGPQSKMTRMIAGSSHNKAFEKEIAELARQGKFSNVGPKSGWHPANRPGSWKDALGLVTRFGNPDFEVVVGSWSESYQVAKINKRARTVTVNFKAANNTDWTSFCHDHACGGGNVASGTGTRVRQEFYWTKVFSWDQWSGSVS